jgi:hypothetical protein
VVCFLFVAGRCRATADQCRFRHDLSEFLAGRPPDLPGNCPFTNASEPCRHGVSCRWALTHTNMNDDAHILLRQHAGKSQRPAGAAVLACGEGAMEVAVPSTAVTCPMVELCPGRALAGSQVRSAGGSDVPSGVMPLVPAKDVQPAVNLLGRGVQVALWKGRCVIAAIHGTEVGDSSPVTSTKALPLQGCHYNLA